jgi:hypothetical protein
VSITLRVEFVPKGILRSSLTKDFTIATSFLCPFDVRYALGRDGTLQDLESATLNARTPALLSTSLICLNSLQHAIGVVGVELHTGESGKSPVGIVTDGVVGHEAVLLQEKTPLPLRSQELVTKTVHIQYIPATPTPPARALTPYAAMLAAQKKESVSVGAQPVALSTGRVEVTWRVLQSHILRRPHIPLSSAGLDSPVKGGSPRTGGANVGLTLSSDGSAAEWSWLHSLGRDREGQTEAVEEIRHLDTKFSVTPVAKLIYPVPEIKVTPHVLTSHELFCEQQAYDCDLFSGGNCSLRRECERAVQLWLAGPVLRAGDRAKQPAHAGARARKHRVQ